MDALRDQIEEVLRCINIYDWLACLTMFALIVQVKHDFIMQKSVKKAIYICAIMISILSVISNMTYCLYGIGQYAELIQFCYTLIYVSVIYLPFVFVSIANPGFFQSTKGIVLGTAVSIYTASMLINLQHPIYFHMSPEGRYIEGEFWWVRPLLGFVVFSVIISSVLHDKYCVTRAEYGIARQLIAYFITGVLFYDFFYEGEFLVMLQAIGLQFTYGMFHRFDMKQCNVTGLPNRFVYINTANELQTSKDVVVGSIDLNDLKKVNDSLGHKAGDLYIRANARTIADALKSFGKVYRTGGDEFMFIGKNLEKCQEVLSGLQKQDKTDIQYGSFNLAFAFGLVEKNKDEDVYGAAERADKLMYINKVAIKGAGNVRNTI